MQCRVDCLSNQVYHEIEPNKQGWLWSVQLGLWLGSWEGKYQGKEEVYLHFFDKDGHLVLTSRERANIEIRRTQAEKLRADLESQRVDAEQQRAESEKQRAERAEAELQALRAAQQQPKS